MVFVLCAGLTHAMDGERVTRCRLLRRQKGKIWHQAQIGFYDRFEVKNTTSYARIFLSHPSHPIHPPSPKSIQGLLRLGAFTVDIQVCVLKAVAWIWMRMCILWAATHYTSALDTVWSSFFRYIPLVHTMSAVFEILKSYNPHSVPRHVSSAFGYWRHKIACKVSPVWM